MDAPIQRYLNATLALLSLVAGATVATAFAVGEPTVDGLDAGFTTVIVGSGVFAFTYTYVTAGDRDRDNDGVSTD